MDAATRVAACPDVAQEPQMAADTDSLPDPDVPWDDDDDLIIELTFAAGGDEP